MIFAAQLASAVAAFDRRALAGAELNVTREFEVGATMRMLATSRPTFASADGSGSVYGSPAEQSLTGQAAAKPEMQFDLAGQGQFSSCATRCEICQRLALGSEPWSAFGMSSPPGGSAPFPLVGRERELRELGALVERGARLLTLTGPGGVGKTRLARELVRQLAESELEVRFADVAPALDRRGLVGAVAAALEVGLSREAALDDAIAALGRALGARGRCLLVLDNVEQVVADAAACAPEWLARAPEATLLFTSREHLAVDGEQRIELSPLATAEARALFLQRAAARGHALPDSDAVASIVERLECLPLSVELAAAQLAVFSAQELSTRLDSLLWLDTDRRDSGLRHSTLAAAVTWSWTLLSPEERRTATELGVFAGPFTLADASLVLGERATFALRALRDKSLLTLEPGPGERRFRMWAAVREHALGADQAVRKASEEKHARALALAAGRESSAWLSAHLPELTLAHARLLGVDAASAARLALCLEPMLTTRGPVVALFELLAASLAGPALPDELRADLLRVRAETLLRRGGSFAEAERDLDEALRIGAPERHAELLSLRAVALSVRGRHGEARELAARAVEELASSAVPRALCLALTRAALTEVSQRNLAAAEPLFYRALELAKRESDRQSEGMLLYNCGGLAHDQRQMGRAHELYVEALGLARELADRRIESRIEYALGCWELEQGTITEARRRLERALSLTRESGDRFETFVLFALGLASVAAGDSEEAALELAMADASLSAWPSARAETLVCCLAALVAARAGDMRRAALAVTRASGSGSASGDPALADAVALTGALVESAPKQVLAELSARAETSGLVETRLLGRAVRGGAAARQPARAAALEIGPDAAWFQLSGTRVELGRRRTLCRILSALARARRDRPGEPVTLEQMLEAAWPGERILAEAAASRVYVAIATLRRMGLRDVLVHSEKGYLLHASVPALVAADI